MTPEAQRIAIAEACGWEWKETSERGGNKFKSCWYHPDYRFVTESANLPDYLNDLNAMYEAMETLTDDQLFTMSRWLQHVTRSARIVTVMHSKAAHRAEAFLKTLNLYK